MLRRLEHTPDANLGSEARAPAWAKFALGGVMIAALAGAVYLMAVRGEALLVDLSALGARIWCF